MKGHIFASGRREAALGWTLLFLGGLLLHDAYDRRGRDVPWWGRPFTFT